MPLTPVALNQPGRGALRARVIRRLMALVGLLLAGVVAGAEPGSVPALAELPREYVDTRLIQSMGRTIHVPPGGDLQSALNTARLGDLITLAAGATYPGPFLLPKKEGTGWLVIRTETADARLESGGSLRVNPARAPLMPHLVAPRGAIISLAPGAHHYRFIGVEVSPAPGTFAHNLIAPVAEPRSDTDQSHHLIFDRCYLHGDPAKGSRRSIALNGQHLAVIHSYVSDFKEVGADSQALAGWNGSGPIRIVDNYLEGGAENVMFGGADPVIPGLVPSDIEIRGNTFAKNPQWIPGNSKYDGSRWTMKNLLELKNARRVLVEANVFEDYDGFAIVITPRNQSGTAPWSTVEDVTIRHNWIRRVSSVLNISGYDEYHSSRPTDRITVEDNIAESLSNIGPPNPKMILINQAPDNVTIRHNTILTPPGRGSSYLIFANATQKKGSAFAFTDNIVQLGTYGLGAENPPLGTSGGTLLDGHFRRWTFSRNILINTQGASPSTYPAGQYWVSSLGAVGFHDPARTDFRLSPKSPYKGRGPNGSDPGAHIESLGEALARFISVPDLPTRERP
jgi:hypothetical protein